MINIDNNRSINNNNINNCGKNFRTPLTPLHRGDLGELNKGDMEKPHMDSLERLHLLGNSKSIVI